MLCTGPHALLHLPISNARRDFPRHGGWRLHTVQTERWPIQRRTFQSEDQDYSDTDERVAIRGWQCTGCTLCWKDAENSGCFLRCVKEVWPEDLHQEDRGAVPTKLYKNPRGRYHMVDGNKLNPVLEFTYLGSSISSNGCIDDEIQRRMANAGASFGRLRQRLWNNHHVSMRVKGKIYRAVVLATLLYGAEAWTVYRRQVKKLHAFMMRHLRSIMTITWMDKVTNKEILERTGLPSMEDLIRKNLRWTGHLMRMSPDRLPKQVLYSQLSSGHRKRGRPRLRFNDTIKRSLKLRDLKTDSWTSLSQQRDIWRAVVKWWKQSLLHRQHELKLLCYCALK